jgi:hypothetical protein
LPRGLREALTCFLQVLAIPVALAEPPPVQTGDIAPPAATPAVVAVAEPGQVVLVRIPGAFAMATALVLGVHGAKPPGAELALSALTEYRYSSSNLHSAGALTATVPRLRSIPATVSAVRTSAAVAGSSHTDSVRGCLAMAEPAP